MTAESTELDKFKAECHFQTEGEGNIEQLKDIVTSMTLLHNACLFGNLQLVQQLIQKGADIYETDDYLNMALHFAARCKDNTKIIEKLVEKASDKKRLLFARNDRGYTALKLAVENNFVSNTSILIRLSIDYDQDQLRKELKTYDGTIETKNMKMLELLKNNDVDCYKKQIIRAARVNNVSLVTEILTKFPDYHKVRNNMEYTPLLEAAQNDNFETVKVLIEKGASISQRTKFKQTILHLVTEHNSIRVFKYLMNTQFKTMISFASEKDASLNLPLHYITKTGNMEMFNALIEYSGDINFRNQFYETPLHLAAKDSREEMFEKLCEISTCSLFWKPMENETLLSIACKNNSIKIIDCILENIGLEAVKNDRKYYLETAFKTRSTALLNKLYKKPLYDYNDAIFQHYLKKAIKNGFTEGVRLILNSTGSNTLVHRQKAPDCIKASRSPMQLIIIFMPDMAKFIFENCITEINNVKEYDFELLDDIYYFDKYYSYYFDDTVPPQAPANVPSQAPAYVPSQAPAYVPGQAPANVPGQAPANVPSQAPANVPGQAPANVPGQAPANVPDNNGAAPSTQNNNGQTPSTENAEREAQNEQKPDVVCKDDNGKLKDRKILRQAGSYAKTVYNHPLNLMIRHKRYDLLFEPLVEKYIDTKWNKMAKRRYYSLYLYYIIFIAILVGIIFIIKDDISGTNAETSTAYENVTKWHNKTLSDIFNDQKAFVMFVSAAPVTVIGIIHLVLTFFTNFKSEIEIYDKFSYCFMNLKNRWIDTLLFLLTVPAGFPGHLLFYFLIHDPYWYWNAIIFLTFLTHISFLNYFRINPRFGIYIVMISNILISISKFAPVFLILILLPCGFFFHVLYKKKNIFTSFVQIMVMMTGEFDYRETIENSPFISFLSFIMFCIFLIIVAISIMNLLNALAIIDTSKVLKEANLIRRILQIEEIHNIEIAMSDEERRKVWIGVCKEKINPEDIHELTSPSFREWLSCFGLSKRAVKEKISDGENGLTDHLDEKFEVFERQIDKRLGENRKETIIDMEMSYQKLLHNDLQEEITLKQEQSCQTYPQQGKLIKSYSF